MAASKEALVIALDVGPSMSASSCLIESLQVINLILQRKLFSESKDEVMVVLFGTSASNNDLHNGNEYAHVSVEKPLAPVTFELIEFVQSLAAETKGVPADFIDALVVAMDELKRNTEGKKAFTSKRIILLSNLKEPFITDQLADIIAALKESGFAFNYIGPCFDDAVKQEETSRTTNGEIKVGKDHSAEGREVLKNILDQTGGEYFSLSELIPCLSFIQSRNIRSTAWKASLKIGTSLDIPICLYVKVKEMKFKNFKNVYSARADAEIERSREYHLIDDQQTEVDKTEVIEGHRYGSTLVPFSADDKEAMKVKTEKCFKVLGFTKAENVKRYQYVGDSVWMCLAEKANEAAQISLSALINALYETNMVAIVRRVYMNGGAVKIGCLFPHIKAKYECLYYVELPFAEDLHQSTFKSLPVSNAAKKNAPTDDQLDVVDKLIDAMDMSCTTKEENNSEELLKPKYLFNPYLQHLFQCIEHKALHPNEHLPTLNPVISHSLQPPQCMVESSKHLLDKISQLFELKPNLENNNELVVDVTSGRLQEADVERSSTLEGFVSEISKSRNLQEACMQVHKNVLQFAADGTLQENQKIFDCFGYLRSESIKNKLCNHFNSLLHELKKSLHGSSRSIFLSELSRKNQGIITKSECCSSTAGSDEAADFFQSTEEDVKPEHINIC